MSLLDLGIGEDRVCFQKILFHQGFDEWIEFAKEIVKEDCLGGIRVFTKESLSDMEKVNG